MTTATPDPLPEIPAKKPLSKPLLAASFILVACIAGAISFKFFPLFEPPSELMGVSPPDHIAVAREASLWNCRLGNSQLLFTGAFAALLGGLWGAIGAWSGRGFHPAVALLTGAVAAAAFAGLAVFFSHLINEINLDPDFHLYRTTSSQLVLLSITGAGLGLSLGLGYGKPFIKFVINGFAAGFLAAVLYIALTSLIMPDSQTDFVVPGGTLSGSKDLPLLAVWFGAMAITFSSIIPMATQKRKS
jgi:hypothetical protein